MKSDNRIVWAVAIGGLLACFTWMYTHPIKVKTTHAVVDSLTNDSLDMADSIDRAFYSDSSVLNDGEITESKPVLKTSDLRIMGTDSISLAGNIICCLTATPKTTHHWNIPDCDSAKSVSPCKVDTNGAFIEYNLHKK